jgi:GNAT superfamily N-acetyltransferase
MKVRELARADLSELIPLLQQLGYPVDADTLIKRFDDFSARGEKGLVADDGGRIIGLLTLHITPVLHRAGSVGRVTTLVVEAASHGKGIGRALMQEAESRLWKEGCVLIEVTSNKTRTDAHVFYEKLGYERTSFRFGKPRPSSL